MRGAFSILSDAITVMVTVPGFSISGLVLSFEHPVNAIAATAMDIILDNVFIAVELIVAALVETRIAAGISFGTILNYAARALGESFFDADIYDVDNRGGVLNSPPLTLRRVQFIRV